jgi:hypothetical protein
MKSVIAIIILAITTFSAQAVEVTIGQAQISHFMKIGAGGQKLHFNEKNEFINVKFNKISVGVFENSFKDLAPYINYEIYKMDVAGLELNITAGVAYYKSSMVDADYSDPYMQAKYNGQYNVKDVTTILPTANINLSKTIGHVTVGATFGGAYTGTFAAWNF